MTKQIYHTPLSVQTSTFRSNFRWSSRFMASVGLAAGIFGLSNMFAPSVGRAEIPRVSTQEIADLAAKTADLCNSSKLCNTDPVPGSPAPGMGYYPRRGIGDIEVWRTLIFGIETPEGPMKAVATVRFEVTHTRFDFSRTLERYVEIIVNGKDLGNVKLDVLGANYFQWTNKKLSYVKLVLNKGEDKTGPWVKIFVVPVDTPNGEIPTHPNTPAMSIFYQGGKITVDYLLITPSAKPNLVTPKVEAVKVVETPTPSKPKVLTKYDEYKSAIYGDSNSDTPVVEGAVIIRVGQILKDTKNTGTLHLTQLFDLYDWVKNNISYLSVEEGWTPRKAGTTLASGQGDCKNMAALLAAMFTSIGARVAVVFVNGHVYNAVQIAKPGENYEEIKTMVELLIRERYQLNEHVSIRMESNADGLWFYFDATLGITGYPGDSDKKPIQGAEYYGTEYRTPRLR